MQNEVGKLSVDIVTKNEMESGLEAEAGIVSFNWRVFWRFLAIWLATAICLVTINVLVVVVKESDSLIKDIISSIDMLNIMFSLVLSVLLEQIWSGDGKGGLHKATITFEMVVAIMGMLLYVSYSLVGVLSDGKNALLEYSYIINLVYIIVATCVVVIGFVSRSLNRGDKG